MTRLGFEPHFCTKSAGTVLCLRHDGHEGPCAFSIWEARAVLLEKQLERLRPAEFEARRPNRVKPRTFVLASIEEVRGDADGIRTRLTWCSEHPRSPLKAVMMMSIDDLESADAKDLAEEVRYRVQLDMRDASYMNTLTAG